MVISWITLKVVTHIIGLNCSVSANGKLSAKRLTLVPLITNDDEVHDVCTKTVEEDGDGTD